MGWKMPLCKWHTFWMVSYLICLVFLLLFFFVILFYIERKWLLMRNVVVILPLKSKLSGKFQRFNAINNNTEMLKIVEFSKILIKIKNCKTFCKSQTANGLKKFIQSLFISPTPLPPPPPPPPDKTLPRLGNNFFLRRYIEIYRHLLPKCFKNAVLWRYEMV